jgi:hypothetical protein
MVDTKNLLGNLVFTYYENTIDKEYRYNSGILTPGRIKPSP